MTVSVQKKVRQTIAARRIRLSSSREIFLIEIENRSFVQESIYVFRQSLRALRSNQFIKTEAPQRFDSACNLRGTGGAGWNRTHVWVLQAEHVLRLRFFPTSSSIEEILHRNRGIVHTCEIDAEFVARLGGIPG